MADMKPAPAFAQNPEDAKKKGTINIGGNLFKHKSDTAVQPAAMADITNQMMNLSRRLRVLEERYDGLRKKTQMIEQNILKQSKDVQREVKTTNADVLEIRRSMEDLRTKARLIVKELMGCAKTEEVKVL